MAELEFHGAAQVTTGSMHILHLPEGPVAMDCGLFQGRRGEAREKNENFPLPPSRLRGVLLSHAHIDHSGNIPNLVRHGFEAPIYATSATCDLCEIMLADSAHIQEEDARFWNEKRAETPADHIRPLYTSARPACWWSSRVRIRSGCCIRATWGGSTCPSFATRSTRCPRRIT